VQTYLVDNEGIINFPTIGKIKVAGLTRNELETKLQEKLAFAFNKELPIITIRIANYSVNIVGEVSRPGKYVTVNDRMTIFESLAMAGDMTIYGRRDNVKVLRENADGTKKIISINLNDKNIIYSPAYYLEQNDVVYIEPNSAKSRSSNIGAEETLTISALSIVISLTSLLVNILK
jgi:polysaccharide export outer membrane protein